MIARLKRMAQHPKFDELGPLTRVLFDDRRLARSSASVERINTHLRSDFLIPNSSMKRQLLHQGLEKKLDHIRAGTFMDYRQEHSEAIFAAFDYMRDKGGVHRESMYFMLDLMLVAGLTEYPLVPSKTSARELEHAAQIVNTIAIYYASQGCLEALKKDKNFEESRFMTLCTFSNEIKLQLDKSANFDELKLVGARCDVYTHALKESLGKAVQYMRENRVGGRHRCDFVAKLATDANRIHEISENAQLLVSLFNEFYAATIPGNKTVKPVLLDKNERAAEKTITLLLDVLSPLLKKLGKRRKDALIIGDADTLMDKAYEFAYHRPDYVLQQRSRHNLPIQWLYVPRVDKPENRVTYPTKVASFLGRNQFKQQHGTLPDNDFLLEHKGGYVARARQKENLYTTAFVEHCKAGTIGMGEDADVIGGVHLPLRYLTVQGSDGLAYQMGQTFEGFLNKNKIVASALNTDEIRSVLNSRLGIKQSDLARLERAGALGRASPVLDFVAQHVSAHPRKYANVGYSK